MELIADSSPSSLAALLVGRYTGLEADGRLSSCRMSSSAAQQLGVASKIPILHTGTEVGVLTDPFTIVTYLANASDVSKALLSTEQFSKGEVDQWVSFAAARQFACSDASTLHTLDSHLESRTFFAAANVTLADLVLFAAVRGWMASASQKERVAHCNLTRWFDHLQHLPGLLVPGQDPHPVEIAVPPFPAHGGDRPQLKGREEEKKGKEQKSDNKQQQPKEKKEKKAAVKDKLNESERPVDDPTRLDIRVGRIIKVWPHPEAERLYCEQIDIGEEKPRSIASGLREHLTIEQMQDQLVLVLANMKEKKLRGYPSHGMVLCAKLDLGEGKEKVELVKPPPGSAVGERVKLEGLEGEADAVMNTKTGKDPFVAVQPGFRTDEESVAFYREHRFLTSQGPCKCESIKRGGIS